MDKTSTFLVCPIFSLKLSSHYEEGLDSSSQTLQTMMNYMDILEDSLRRLLMYENERSTQVVGRKTQRTKCLTKTEFRFMKIP